MTFVTTYAIRQLIDQVPDGRLDSEAIAALENIGRYAREVELRVRDARAERQRIASQRPSPFEAVGELVYDPTDDTLERPFPADSLRER